MLSVLKHSKYTHTLIVSDIGWKLSERTSYLIMQENDEEMHIAGICNDDHAVSTCLIYILAGKSSAGISLYRSEVMRWMTYWVCALLLFGTSVSKKCGWCFPGEILLVCQECQRFCHFSIISWCWFWPCILQTSREYRSVTVCFVDCVFEGDVMLTLVDVRDLNLSSCLSLTVTVSAGCCWPRLLSVGIHPVRTWKLSSDYLDVSWFDQFNCINITNVCQMLFWWTKNSLYSINI